MKRDVKLRTQFPENYDTNKVSDETGLDTGTEGGAKQSFKDECDINVILKRFGLGYELPESTRIPQAADFSDVVDFHTAMNRIRAAQENFDAMPAHIRARFDNDPGKFHDYAIDEKNLEGLAELGLLNERGQQRAKTAAETRKAAEDAAAADRHAKRTTTQTDKPKT